jgi:hypothetical protein
MFQHVHSSSRFDRSVPSLFAAASRYNLLAELVTYTEVDKEKREEGIRKANGDVFGLVSGDESNKNDCAISYKKSRFRLIGQEQFLATKIDYTPGGVDLYATIALLEDRSTHKRIIVCVIHLPAHIETDMRRGKSTAKTRAWYRAFARTKRRCNFLMRRHRAVAVLLVADYNLNFKKEWVRNLLKHQAPKYKHTWHNLKVRLGTHGKRIIDATLIRGKMKGSARLFVDDDSSDHRPYVETLVYT